MRTKAILIVPVVVASAVVAVVSSVPSAHATTDKVAGAGPGVVNLIRANVGRRACSANSSGGEFFGTSCTGNGGQPEPWSADFAAWIWGNEGLTTTGLTTATGNATPASFLAYGQAQKTLHTDPGYTPQPGDVIVYDSPADYVSLVTAYNPDGSLLTVGGDWGGQDIGHSDVEDITLGANELAVGSQPAHMALKTIAAYVSPSEPAGYSAGLIPFGAITWTPPGTTTPRVDVYAADAGGQLWDYTKTSDGTLTNAPAQVESGFTRYRPVGVADFNGNGYPDLEVVDTNGSSPLDVFMGTSSGLATTPTVVPNTSGWTGVTPFGVADFEHNGVIGVIAVQNSTGNQYYYPTDVNGTGTPILIGTGWTNNFAPFGVSQFTGDGSYDIFTCRADTKNLMMYPGDSQGGFAGPRTILGGCDRYTPFGVTDYDGDGNPDLILRDNTTGDLVIPANGSESTPGGIGTVIDTTGATKNVVPWGAVEWTPPGSTTKRVDIFGVNSVGTVIDYTEAPGAPLNTTPTVVADSWVINYLTYRPVGIADFNHDGYPDIEVIKYGGDLAVFLGSANGWGNTLTTVPNGGGWTTDLVPFGVTDFQKTGHTGVIAVERSTQNLFYYPIDLTGNGSRVQIGAGWSTNFHLFGVAGMDGDGNADLLTCRADNNRLVEFPGNGTGGFFAGRTVLVGCANHTSFGIADYNGDGNPDLILRDDTTGDLIVDAGNGGGWWTGNSTRPPIATGM